MSCNNYCYDPYLYTPTHTPTHTLKHTSIGEYVKVIVDFGGLVEDLYLKSPATGKMRTVLLTHDDDATAVLENKWWQSMLLLPWANRIDCVSASVK